MASGNGIDSIEIIKDHVASLDERHANDIREIKNMLKEHVEKSGAKHEELAAGIREIKDQISAAKTVARTIKVIGGILVTFWLFFYTPTKTVILQLFK